MTNKEMDKNKEVIDYLKRSNDKNFHDTLETFNKYKGQIVMIHSLKYIIERFIGIAMDDSDYLWITFNGNEVKFHTILDRLTPLKGFINDEDYNYMVHIAKLNNIDLISGENQEETLDRISSLIKEHKGMGEIVLLSDIYLNIE